MRRAGGRDVGTGSAPVSTCTWRRGGRGSSSQVGRSNARRMCAKGKWSDFGRRADRGSEARSLQPDPRAFKITFVRQWAALPYVTPQPRLILTSGDRRGHAIQQNGLRRRISFEHPSHDYQLRYACGASLPCFSPRLRIGGSWSACMYR
jgi:hypothetical protein